jgi:hypothetical protein
MSRIERLLNELDAAQERLNELIKAVRDEQELPAASKQQPARSSDDEASPRPHPKRSERG